MAGIDSWFDRDLWQAGGCRTVVLPSEVVGQAAPAQRWEEQAVRWSQTAAGKPAALGQ